MFKLIGKIIVLLLIVQGVTIAQSEKRFRIGPHLGLGMTQISKLRAGEEAIYRPTFGLAFDVKINPNVTFSSGLTHRTTGEFDRTKSYPTDLTTLETYHSLMIPITFKLHPKKGPFFGLIGIQPGFVYKGAFEVNEVPQGNSYYRKLDFGGTAGFGFNLGQNLALDLRYYQGVVNLNKSRSMAIPGYGLMDIKKEFHRQLALTVYCYF